MADVDRVAQIEVCGDRGDVSSVMVHVVPVADLARPSVPAPVMSDDAVALLQEIEQLVVPVIAAERPTMMEHDGLRALRALVLVENRRAIVCRDRTHVFSSPRDTLLVCETSPQGRIEISRFMNGRVMLVSWPAHVADVQTY